MTVSLDALAERDIVEIKYRVWKPACATGEHASCEDVADRWIGAVVLASEPAAWPLVRLADGQVTEVRPFMTWRLVARGGRVPFDAAA
jgi:hypothetical protein